MKTKVFHNDVSGASDMLQRGGLVAVPTETVYGLAANARDELAVEKIYEVKGRPPVKPLSLLVPGCGALDEYGTDVPTGARVLAEKFWPGPLTIVLRAKPGAVPGIVLAGGDTVGLRCPDHPLTLALLRQSGLPLAVPSANPSGAPPPKTAGEVLAYFDGKIDGVVDGGPCGIGEASTVFDMSRTPYRVLRGGALTQTELADALAEAVTLIGITGGSGSGKTTALKVLKVRGALILDCDAIYHELTVTSQEMKEEICRRFGGVYDESGLNRKRLGEIVFRDEKALADLNAITHRYVNEELSRRLREYSLTGGTLAAIDAIALLETDYARRTVFNVAVTAPVEARVQRLLRREGVTEEYARMRIAAQKSDEYFVSRCDYVLENDAGFKHFQLQCKRFFDEKLKDLHK